jgi:hypothetical protein
MRYLTYAEFCAELDAYIAAHANDDDAVVESDAMADEAAAWLEARALAA